MAQDPKKKKQDPLSAIGSAPLGDHAMSDREKRRQEYLKQQEQKAKDNQGMFGAPPGTGSRTRSANTMSGRANRRAEYLRQQRMVDDTGGGGSLGLGGRGNRQRTYLEGGQEGSALAGRGQRKADYLGFDPEIEPDPTATPQVVGPEDFMPTAVESPAIEVATPWDDKPMEEIELSDAFAKDMQKSVETQAVAGDEAAQRGQDVTDEMIAKFDPDKKDWGRILAQALAAGLVGGFDAITGANNLPGVLEAQAKARDEYNARMDKAKQLQIFLIKHPEAEDAFEKAGGIEHLSTLSVEAQAEIFQGIQDSVDVEGQLAWMRESGYWADEKMAAFENAADTNELAWMVQMDNMGEQRAQNRKKVELEEFDAHMRARGTFIQNATERLKSSEAWLKMGTAEKTEAIANIHLQGDQMMAAQAGGASAANPLYKGLNPDSQEVQDILARSKQNADAAANVADAEGLAKAVKETQNNPLVDLYKQWKTNPEGSHYRDAAINNLQNNTNHDIAKGRALEGQLALMNQPKPGEDTATWQRYAKETGLDNPEIAEDLAWLKTHGAEGWKDDPERFMKVTDALDGITGKEFNAKKIEYKNEDAAKEGLTADVNKIVNEIGGNFNMPKTLGLIQSGLELEGGKLTRLPEGIQTAMIEELTPQLEGEGLLGLLTNDFLKSDLLSGVRGQLISNAVKNMTESTNALDAIDDSLHQDLSEARSGRIQMSRDTIDYLGLNQGEELVSNTADTTISEADLLDVEEHWWGYTANGRLRTAAKALQHGIVHLNQHTDEELLNLGHSQQMIADIRDAYRMNKYVIPRYSLVKYIHPSGGLPWGAGSDELGGIFMNNQKNALLKQIANADSPQEKMRLAVNGIKGRMSPALLSYMLTPEFARSSKVSPLEEGSWFGVEFEGGYFNASHRWVETGRAADWGIDPLSGRFFGWTAFDEDDDFGEGDYRSYRSNQLMDLANDGAMVSLLTDPDSILSNYDATSNTFSSSGTSTGHVELAQGLMKAGNNLAMHSFDIDGEKLAMINEGIKNLSWELEAKGKLNQRKQGILTNLQEIKARVDIEHKAAGTVAAMSNSSNYRNVIGHISSDSRVSISDFVTTNKEGETILNGDGIFSTLTSGLGRTSRLFDEETGEITPASVGGAWRDVFDGIEHMDPDQKQRITASLLTSYLDTREGGKGATTYVNTILNRVYATGLGEGPEQDAYRNSLRETANDRNSLIDATYRKVTALAPADALQTWASVRGLNIGNVEISEIVGNLNTQDLRRLSHILAFDASVAVGLNMTGNAYSTPAEMSYVSEVGIEREKQIEERRLAVERGPGK
tara:strand:- start:9205 stop:13155 length:3951 start_codon:yes stop_codon:yes gene_type:complete